jgi:hypothetical protein
MLDFFLAGYACLLGHTFLEVPYKIIQTKPFVQCSLLCLFLFSHPIIFLQDFQGLWSKNCTTPFVGGGLDLISWNCTILCGICNSLGCLSACFVCLDRPRHHCKICFHLYILLSLFFSLPSLLFYEV